MPDINKVNKLVSKYEEHVATTINSHTPEKWIETHSLVIEKVTPEEMLMFLECVQGTEEGNA